MESNTAKLDVKKSQGLENRPLISGVHLRNEESPVDYKITFMKLEAYLMLTQQWCGPSRDLDTHMILQQKQIYVWSFKLSREPSRSYGRSMLNGMICF